jgi:hypothetical protein
VNLRKNSYGGTKNNVIRPGNDQSNKATSLAKSNSSTNQFGMNKPLVNNLMSNNGVQSNQINNKNAVKPNNLNMHNSSKNVNFN